MSSWHLNNSLIPQLGHVVHRYVVCIKVVVCLLFSLEVYSQQSPPPADTLATELAYNNSSYGVMFDIESIRGTALEYLHANLGVSLYHRIRIYYKQGSHQGWESDQLAWTFLGEALNVASNGLDTLTRIPIPLNLDIAAGDTAAFYIAVVSAVPGDIGAPSHILYTETDSLGFPLATDDHLILRTGVALGGFNSLPFQGNIVSPRAFNGAVEYSSRRILLDCPPDTSLTCNGNTMPLALGVADVTSYCSNDWTLTYSDSLIQMDSVVGIDRTIYRTWIATDECNNYEKCSQKILLIDTVAPVVQVLSPPVIQCSETSFVNTISNWFVQYVQTEDCGSLSLVYDTAVFAIPDAGCGVQDFELIVADYSGNQTVISTELMVFDTTPPSMDVTELDIVLDQEDLIRLDFDDINSDSVSSVDIGGVSIDIMAQSRIGPEEAWVYNTGNPTSNDPDLGTPNVMYAGHGMSQDDPKGWSPSNNSPLGNVLIVQNPFSVIPDDFFLSESLGFSFDRPVFLHAIKLLDIEASQAGAHIKCFDSQGIMLDSIPVVGGKDNSVLDLLIAVPNVREMVFYFGGDFIASGAIAELSFALIPGLPENIFSDACSAISLDSSWVMEVIDRCECKLVQSASAIDQCGNMSSMFKRGLDIQFDVIPPSINYLGPVYALCDSTYPEPDPTVFNLEEECSPVDHVNIAWAGDFETTVPDVCGGLKSFRLYWVEDIYGNGRFVRQEMSRVKDFIPMKVKLMLAGSIPFGGSQMFPSINAIIPVEQPYQNRFGHTGMESLESVPGQMIDWILVQLYDNGNEAIVASMAAMLFSDGTVRSVDDSEFLEFLVPEGEYFVRIRHRNHLDIVSQTSLTLEIGSVTECDFIEGWFFADEPPSYLRVVNVDPLQVALQPGDANADQKISYLGLESDRQAILEALGVETPANSLIGYLTEDVNFDGIVNFDGGLTDRLTILLTVGFATPANIIHGPLDD